MIYADTTFLVAYNVRTQPFFRVSRKLFEQKQDEVWLWSPWHRVEVFNSVRQLTLVDKPLRISPDEAGQVIRLIEADVRCDYLQHTEADWRDVLRRANEISIANATSLVCRAADLLHVAYAVELSAELFVSFDGDQLALARTTGMETLRPS